MIVTHAAQGQAGMMKLGIRLLVGVCALSAAVGSHGDAAAQQITVGPNVQASEARPDRTHYEIHLAASPDDPGSLLGGSMIWDAEAGVYTVVAYASRDGGRSWTPTLDVKNTDYVNDPAVAFGPDGAAYLSAFGADIGEDVEMYVHRSTDGGLTWNGSTRVPGMDREWITVDRTDGEYRGRVYLNGTRGAAGIDGRGASGMSVIHSADNGISFQGPNTLVVSDPLHYVIGMGNGVVLSDGTLVLLFGQWRDRTAMMRPGDDLPAEPTGYLKTVTSTDGGERFSPATLVADWYMHFPGSMMPYLAADETDGVFRDRIYAVWADYRSGRGEILLSWSADKAKTWSAPVVVNDDSRVNDGQDRDHFMPLVAVNRNGVVGVMWYDRRDHPGNAGWLTRFTVSMDGGETFLPSVPASTAAFDFDRSEAFAYTTSSTAGTPRGGPLQAEVTFHGFNKIGGHTAGLAASADGAFHPFWVDNRTGVPQIWTAAVTVSGSAVRNGDPALAALEDATSKVELQLSNIEYDAATGTGHADARIMNTSQDTLAGPLLVRVLTLASQHGTPLLQDSDNGRTGAGAVLDFTATLPEGGLAPDARTDARRLEFRLDDVRALDVPTSYPRGRGGSAIISLTARVLSGPTAAAPAAGASPVGRH